MPLQRLAVPVLACAVGLIALWMVNREFIVPELAPQIARERQDVVGTRHTGIGFARDEHNVILMARGFNVQARRLERVLILVPDEDAGYVVQADVAVYDPQDRTWRLEGGTRLAESGPRAGEQAGGRGREPINEFPFSLTPEDLLLRRSVEWAGMLSLRQMNALLHSRNLPNRQSVVMHRHIWLTQPMLQLILVGLTLPFFLRREPTSVLVAGGRALLVAGAFFATQFFAHNMEASPWVSLLAWLPILVFAPIAVLQMANLRT